MLDPDIRRLLDTVFATPADTPASDVAALRTAAEAAPALLGGAPEPVASVSDLRAAGPAGALPMRVYRPQLDAVSPAILFAHGGGWVTGSLDSHDRLCRILANRTGAIVVAVDYRRAPEDVYPAALDDVEAAWLWLRAEARSLGADGTRFAVAGDSSGGNLVAALTLRLRARGAPQPQLQLLLYPALDATCGRSSYREFATGHNLAAAQMAWYWETYRAGAEPTAPELSPLAAENLSGLAPAVVAVAAADVLRDDGKDYALGLEGAGVPTRVIECTGMIHGFLRWTGEVRSALAWIDTIASAADEFLAPPEG